MYLLSFLMSNQLSHSEISDDMCFRLFISRLLFFIVISRRNRRLQISDEHFKASPLPAKSSFVNIEVLILNLPSTSFRNSLFIISVLYYNICS